MKYVALLTIVDHEKNRESRPDHLSYLDNLYQQGLVHMAGPFPDGTGGLVIYQDVTEAEAKRLAAEDPAVTSGARTVELKLWEPLAFPLS